MEMRCVDDDDLFNVFNDFNMPLLSGILFFMNYLMMVLLI